MKGDLTRRGCHISTRRTRPHRPTNLPDVFVPPVEQSAPLEVDDHQHRRRNTGHPDVALRHLLRPVLLIREHLVPCARYHLKKHVEYSIENTKKSVVRSCGSGIARRHVWKNIGKKQSLNYDLSRVLLACITVNIPDINHAHAPFPPPPARPTCHIPPEFLTREGLVAVARDKGHGLADSAGQPHFSRMAVLAPSPPPTKKHKRHSIFLNFVPGMRERVIPQARVASFGAKRFLLTG